VVVVAGGPAHVHEVPVPDRVERCAEAQPGDQVRVGEERPAERHQIGAGRRVIRIQELYAAGLRSGRIRQLLPCMRDRIDRMIAPSGRPWTR